jgi:predicted dinucleotide-binding enzyme
LNTAASLHLRSEAVKKGIFFDHPNQELDHLGWPLLLHLCNRIKQTHMKKIAVIGTGTVGQTFATRLVALGYEVLMGTRNVSEKLGQPAKGQGPSFKEWNDANPQVKLVTFADAAKEAELIINVTQGGASINAMKLCGEKNLEGKVIMDVANPLDFSRGAPPHLIPELSNINSLGEEIQKTFPKSMVVKTLNTMWCGIMVNPKMVGNGDHTNYICGDNQQAKEKVTGLLKQFGWDQKNILDLGPISSARGTEAVLPVWLRIWTATQNGAFNFKIVS